jgi:hypothetical protein
MKYLLFIISAISSWGVSIGTVNVSTITRTNNVVTVTCLAPCGIATNQGFVLLGVTDTSFNQDGVALTGSGTTFTFSQTGANGSSTGGTVAPEIQIIILNISADPQGESINGLFWITTTSGVPTGMGSVWTGASVQANNAIKAGLLIEIPFSRQYGPTTTKATIQADLVSSYIAQQATQSTAAIQPGQFYGGTYNGGWSF